MHVDIILFYGIDIIIQRNQMIVLFLIGGRFPITKITGYNFTRQSFLLHDDNKGPTFIIV